MLLLNKHLRAVKKEMTRIAHLPSDIIYDLRNPRTMIPPKHKWFVGGGDFLKTGVEFKQYLIDFAELVPMSNVLDVGCGIGRMAVPLTDYLSSSAQYRGIDIVKDGIDWCADRITPKHPNFEFVHSNIHNKLYNDRGVDSAAAYRFPFPDGMFDVVLLTSVFTHMQTAEVENYLGEIARVLKSGGRCLATFFLINEEATTAQKNGDATLDFKFPLEGCLTTNAQIPEAAIAFDERDIKQKIVARGFDASNRTWYGSWCRKTGGVSFQDIVVFRKRA